MSKADGYPQLRRGVSKMNRRPTLDEAKVKPQHSIGPPARSRSNYDAILELLRERGPQGILGSELYSRPNLFGRSPRNCISELRRDGHLIERLTHGVSNWFYRLIRNNYGVSTTPRAESSDWYERQHGPRPSGPDPDAFQLSPPEPRQ